MSTLAPLEAARSGSLLTWAADNLGLVRARLHSDGVLRLRGSTEEPADLCQQLLGLLGGQAMEDVFFSTPRTRVQGRTFTATEYPSRLTIAPHSEMSYLTRYPRLLCFQAVQCADSGGQTSVADLDAVSDSLGDLVREVAERGVRYLRVFREGIDVPLSTAFGTSDA